MEKTQSFFSQHTAHDLAALEPTEKFSFVLGFWPLSNIQPRDVGDANYLQFFQFLGGELAELEDHRHEFAVQNFDSLLAIIDDLRTEHTKTEILAALQKRFLNIDKECIIRSMELAARLWLTVNVRTSKVDVGPAHAEDSLLEWPDDASLQSMITRHFRQLKTANPHLAQIVKIDPSLSVTNLVRYHGVHIRWTDNLLDHLNLEGNELFIYRHKICLENHRRTGVACALPLDLVEETIDTLNLLFSRDWPTRSFLCREGQALYSVGNCGRELVFDLEGYKYWGNRLRALCTVLNRPPYTVRQLWADKRNADRWFTFWTSTCSVTLAVIGIIITTIASIVGTYYTAKQYEVARAQACLIPDAKNLLPQICA